MNPLFKLALKIFPPTHVRLYRLTGGAVGGSMRGAKVILVTTIGRKSGLERTSPLLYIPDDHPDHAGAYIIVASKGGAPKHPAWYLNLSANPEVTVQDRREVKKLVASTVDDADRERLWPQLVAAWPDYDSYQRKTDRKIPVVRLSAP